MKRLLLVPLFFFAHHIFSQENKLSNRDLISIRDLSKEDIELVLDTAHQYMLEPNPKTLERAVLATCFYEPSTRTRLSFESAMLRHGGSVIGFTDVSTVSVMKGETLSDTMKTIDQYADIIVIRHPTIGSAKIASEVCTHPVINAGDGANEHPTQSLVDLFSIKECQGKLDNLHIGIVGDLLYGRTAHSLCLALSHFDVTIHCIAEPSLELPMTLLEELKEKNTAIFFHHSIEEVISEIDILYMTRLQKERFERNTHEVTCHITCEHLKNVKENLRILHPFPRNGELDTSVDETPYAYYFQQMNNGVFVRMALIDLLLRNH